MRKDYTHITLVLDRSGSMESIKGATIEGVNAFLKAHREAPGDCTVTLALFDAPARLDWQVNTPTLRYVVMPSDDSKDLLPWYWTPYMFAPIAEAANLDEHTFEPRGMTALLDAMARAIRDTGVTLRGMSEDRRPEQVLFVTMTDGEENSSRETTRGALFTMIEHQREKYGWAFGFLGANQDAIAEGKTFGYTPFQTLNVGSSAYAVRAAYTATAANTVKYRGGGGRQSLTFTSAQRREQEAEGAVKADDAPEDTDTTA